MLNPNSSGDSKLQASSSDDKGWDSLSQVTFRGGERSGERTGEYSESNEGKQEISIEEVFDKWSEKIDDMVREGKITEEEGYRIKEDRLDSAIEAIDTVRQDYLDRINGRTPQKSEPSADYLAYEEWLANRSGRSEGYEPAHGKASGPAFSDMDFSRPRDVRDKVIKDADGNIVGVDREDSKPRTYSEWDVYNRQKGETSREFGDRAKSRHEAEERYKEREKLIQDVMRQHDVGKIDRATRDKKIQTIMNAAPKPQDEKTQAVVNVSPEPQEIVADLPGEENPTEDKKESQINETAPMETRDEKPNPEVVPVETRDEKPNPEVVPVETVNDTSTKADVAKPQAKKGFFGKIRSLFSRNKQKKNRPKSPSQLAKEQLAQLEEFNMEMRQKKEKLNPEMEKLRWEGAIIKQMMDSTDTPPTDIPGAA